jgi:membrane-associated phospholipid phosphatase
MDKISEYKFNKQSYPQQILRAMPVMTVFYSAVNIIQNPCYKSIILFIALIYDKIFNVSLKTLSEYLYDLYGKDEIPKLGRGKRPKGAKNTSCFLKYPEQISTSYGMPSGHSQNAWLFATYLIMNILYNPSYINNLLDNNIIENKRIINYLKICSVIIIVVIASMVSISRVIERCHTIQQVVIGGIIGSLLGYSTYLLSCLM